MIQFQHTNQKGERVKAYTHKNYLSHQYVSQILKTEKSAQTINGFLGYGSLIASYWLFNNVPQFRNLVESKLHMKGKYLIASTVVGLLTTFLITPFQSSSVKRRHENLLKNEVFPAWFNKEKVVNPDRVFFELDDSKNNEPSIWHSGITATTIERLIPDFIVGNPHKPHVPVAQEHHH